MNLEKMIKNNSFLLSEIEGTLSKSYESVSDLNHKWGEAKVVQKGDAIFSVTIEGQTLTLKNFTMGARAFVCHKEGDVYINRGYHNLILLEVVKYVLEKLIPTTKDMQKKVYQDMLSKTKKELSNIRNMQSIALFRISNALKIDKENDCIHVSNTSGLRHLVSMSSSQATVAKGFTVGDDSATQSAINNMNFNEQVVLFKVPTTVSVDGSKMITNSFLANRHNIDLAIYNMLVFDLFPSVVEASSIDRLDSVIRKRLYDLSNDLRPVKLGLSTNYFSVVQLLESLDKPLAAFVSGCISPVGRSTDFTKEGIASLDAVLDSDAVTYGELDASVAKVFDSRLITTDTQMSDVKRSIKEFLALIFGLVSDKGVTFKYNDSLDNYTITIDVYESNIFKYLNPGFSNAKGY